MLVSLKNVTWGVIPGKARGKRFEKVKTMFDHSIKVPRLYKTACKIAKQVSDGKGSIKQLVYEGKHPNIKALYALVVHTFQRTDDIENLFKKSKLLIKEPRFDPWLAKVLITELLWGKKRLAGQSKPVMTILAYEQIFKAHLSDVSTSHIEDVMQVYKPRYVRINTLKTSINEAVEGFRDEGWILKRYTDANNYASFLEAVNNLGPEEFMIDFHIPYLLIFPHKTQFYRHHAYKNGMIILQDKASCLPVHILNPQPESTVLDMCAAPGMKTTQCAALLENRGSIHAVEIGKNRYETLKKITESSGATCVNTVNADVLTLTGNDYPDVEYILVDPSCSGSGITDRVEIGQQEMDQHKNRLEKLAGFQIKILRHALTRFSMVKRVVYSTCSVYPEENEDVVRQVLETTLNFKLVPAVQFVKNQWSNFGSSDFGNIGSYTLYAKPDIDFTSGFFVAVFERVEDGERNPFLNERLFSQKMQRRRQHKSKEELPNQETEHTDEVPKKKRRNNDGSKNQDYEDVHNDINPEENVSVVRKSKKSKHQNIISEAGREIESDVQEVAIPGEKKKKRKTNFSLTEHKDERLHKCEESDIISKEIVNKKKKSKIRAASSEKLECVEENIGNLENVTTSKKQKKKKEKQSTSDEAVLNIEQELVANDQKNENKKKKSKKDKLKA